jgi:hypothetical protein
MAWLNLHGVKFYEGSFDLTWPGALALHELYIIIFGVNSWTARAGDFLLLQPATFALFYFLRRAGFQMAAIAAALLYPILYVTSGPWMAGHRDIIGAHFLIGAAALALPRRKHSIWLPVIAGILVGYAVMIRPTYLAFAPMILILAAPSWNEGHRTIAAYIKTAAIFGLALSIVPICFAIYAIANDSLGAWYIDAFRFPLEVYQVPESRSRLFAMAASFIASSLWWPALTGAAGGSLWVVSGRCRQALWLLAGICLTIVISYFAQNKGFGYHLGGLIPVLLLLACGGIEATFRSPIRSRIFPIAIGAGTALLLIAGTSLRLVHARPTAPDCGHEDRQGGLKLADALAVSSIVRAESNPNDTFLQWGWEYQVSFLAQRRSPTKFINTLAARQVTSMQPVFGKWLEEFDSELTSRPPKFILVEQTVGPGAPVSAANALAKNEMAEILKRHIGKGYFVRYRKGAFTLLKRVR